MDRAAKKTRSRTPDMRPDERHVEHALCVSPQRSSALDHSVLDHSVLASANKQEKTMAPIGPQLPAHAAPTKRKRTPSPRRRPPQGPTLPSVDDDDDDFGPAPVGSAPPSPPAPASPPPPSPPRRDAWMLAPPPSGGPLAPPDLARPLRARKFASGPRRPDAAAGDSTWTETAEQKRRRLADAVLGRGPDPAPADGAPQRRRRADGEAQDEDGVAQRVRSYTEQTRGQSLYAEHRQTRRHGGREAGQHTDEPQDDPSARVFDKDKDMALGRRISAAQRRDLVDRSAGFSDRFTNGSFL